MSGKFEIYKDKAGEFRFRLKAGNDQIVLTGEGYKAKAGCMNGVESVMKNAPDDSRFKKYETASGKHAFNLVAGNSQVIGVSQPYASDSGRDAGIDAVKRAADSAAIDDQTA